MTVTKSEISVIKHYFSYRGQKQQVPNVCRSRCQHITKCCHWQKEPFASLFHWRKGVLSVLVHHSHQSQVFPEGHTSATETWSPHALTALVWATKTSKTKKQEIPVTYCSNSLTFHSPEMSYHYPFVDGSKIFKWIVWFIPSLPPKINNMQQLWRYIKIPQQQKSK